MQQFIGTTGEQGSDVQTHSEPRLLNYARAVTLLLLLITWLARHICACEVAFNTLLLAACTGSTFSVVAVVALPEENSHLAPSLVHMTTLCYLQDTPSDLSTAELRFKAMEIHAALRSGVRGQVVSP